MIGSLSGAISDPVAASAVTIRMSVIEETTTVRLGRDDQRRRRSRTT